MISKDVPLLRGESVRKIDPWVARVVAPEVLDDMIARALPRVPVTRVSEVSRLERGTLPVFSATTPLAKDLTTHMGKGLTREAARASAVMEAVERVSGEACRGPARLGSRDELRRDGINCVDPQAFDLPPATRYRPDRDFTWVEGWDLLAAEPVWIPADLCQSPPGEGLLDQVDTNGLASGATFGEAIRHALMEIVERDAMSQQLFFEHFGAGDADPPPRIGMDPEGLTGGPAQAWSQIATETTRIVLDDISTDIGVPVVACLLVDEAYPTPAGPRQVTFGGWGCDPCRDLAVARALTEAHQSRIGTLQGTRDSFNLFESPQGSARPRLRTDGLRGCQDLPPCAPPNRDLSEDIALVLDHLQAGGIDSVVVVDMTDPEIGIPVVRVRVPHLSVYAVDRQRVGWRAMRHIL